MEEINTALGTVFIGKTTDLFEKTISLIEKEVTNDGHTTLGLTGGSTPKAFYKWCYEGKKLSDFALENIRWSVTDERMVPLESEENNFGNAKRLLLDPLNIPEKKQHPWPTNLDPHSASIVLNRNWNHRYGIDLCYDLAFFGMGDDAHTASIFPGNSLLGVPISDNFTCVQVPEKGWRLTITEAGISRCCHLIVTVTGKSKQRALKQVFEGKEDLNKYPAQIFRKYAKKTVWLIDDEAAAGLKIAK